MEMEGIAGHALLFPFPAQGHINPMMQLAKILSSRQVFITFVNTDFIHQRLNPKPNPRFRFESFPDGLSSDHVRTLKLPELCESTLTHAPPHIENIVANSMHSPTVPPITFIVSDGVLSFTQEIADKYGIPRVSFWTTSACGFSAYFHMPLLIDRGCIPLEEEDQKRLLDNDELITAYIPGMSTLRLRDLPSFLTVKDSSDFMFQYLKREAQNTRQAALVLLNTFEELEGAVLKDLRSKLSEKVLSVGSLLLSAIDIDGEAATTSIWKEETACLEWLDKQEASSVIYVSFGSITVLSDQELVEFALGLEASNQPFLWAIRPDLVQGQSAVLPQEFLNRTKNRSFFVGWAPQTKVLFHPSVGGFLTHNGWNSTLESICAGVPMICWPFFAEQPTNRRFVNYVWKIGFEMNNKFSRDDVKTMVKGLMSSSGEEAKEMRRRALELKEKAFNSVKEGGSSCNHLKTFFQEMMLL
eukprot:Gb_31148 [translate_table: standard]